MTLTVLRVTGLATVQDLGRAGFMHMGVPRGGALVPELLARANAAAHNEDAAPAIELVGSMVLRANAEMSIGTDDGHAHALDARATFELRASPRVRYLAVRGGLSVPRVLGGHGTLLSAKIGGHEGRLLARDDVLAVGDAGIALRELPRAPRELGAIRVVPGPDVDRFEAGLAALLDAPWHVGLRRDRAGVALEGAPIFRRDHDPLASAPMVRGAIQVPPSGEPIVLGPDHPTTGGYPVIAVLVTADLGAFFARTTGARVDLALAT